MTSGIPGPPGREPKEPEGPRWRFPDPRRAADDLVAVGADLEPDTLAHAYAEGLFPMGLGADGGAPMGWWSPRHRGVLLPGDFHASRSLIRSTRHLRVSVDRAFDAVVAGCADPSRPGRWISAEIAAAYQRLHRLGRAHSIDVWREEPTHGDRRLVGGLYGVVVGGVFAGESMFHLETDASKVALLELCRRWFADADDRRLIDVQWCTPHLASMGVREIDRAYYLDRLAQAQLVTGLDPLAR
ncbi:MAG: leucyl/phenylalanyl-tRNA--protein transferase [Nostocoides sp.]